MTLVLELPEKLEQELSHEAIRLGLPLSEYTIRLLSLKQLISSISPFMQETVTSVSIQFKLPDAVQNRLQSLLDKQDIGGKLTKGEREEAEGLVELAELLSLLNLRTKHLL